MGKEEIMPGEKQFVSYQGMTACCTVVFPAGFQGKSSRHNVEGDWCSFENVLGNQFHRTECMKSIHSNLTNHRVLYCNDKTKRSSSLSKSEVQTSKEGEKKRQQAVGTGKEQKNTEK